MFLTIKRKISNGFLAAGDIAGLVLSVSGASAVALIGKLMLAVVLAALALGFFLRLTGRRKPEAFQPVSTPTWCYFASVVLALIEVALLTEITSLPIRFHQTGFAPWHWALVVVALVVAYGVQMQIFRSFTSKHTPAK
jgi:hypothetical protein